MRKSQETAGNLAKSTLVTGPTAGECGPARGEPGLLLLCDHRGSGLAKQSAQLGRGGWRVDVTQSALRTRQVLTRSKPDVVVLDPLIEGGREEIAELDRAGAARVPLLLLADPDHIERAVAVWGSVNGRIVDIVHRGADPVEVSARVEHLSAARAAREELRRLRHRANHDDRTELLRPEAFERRLIEHWSASERHGHPLALAIADLDRFGQLNKRYDHTIGDRVLTRVGEVIRAALRTEDVAGRLGGDEFGFVLPYTSPADAARVVERLRANIRALSIEVEGEVLPISASLGFDTFDGRDVDSPETLRQRAEFALRESKRRGGNRALAYRSLRSPSASFPAVGEA